MSTKSNMIQETLELPPLKVSEPRVNVVIPWTDDELDRETIAGRLTKVVEDQEAPFVISLDGRWGTGKTFLLKRWQQELVNEPQGFKAIYFNAWEDDFSDDPLLAIIGQLTEHFREGTLGRMANALGNVALPILTSKLTGVAFKAKDLRPESLLSDYHKQQETKHKVRERLEQLAAEVRNETGKPLVFIIDELDRCRPTFAIELLERVKHIFDVPNIVFVFGINKSELVKSLNSVYGEIDAEVYLRRFFDMEFTLPEADAQKFCAHLLRIYGLTSYFSKLSKALNNRTPSDEFSSVASTLPVIVSHIGLSLRDIDYCVRLLALAARGDHPFPTGMPTLFVLLVTAKLSNPFLYQRVVYGSGRGAELLDYVNERNSAAGVQYPRTDSREWSALTFVEAAIYCADDGPTSLNQLVLLQRQAEPSLPQYLAKETASLKVGVADHGSRIERLSSVLKDLIESSSWEPISLASIARNIDLHSESISR